MHLAHGEVVELERQFRRRPRVRELLVRQGDVETDGRRPGLVRALVGGLHDARPAARGDDVVAHLARLAPEGAAAFRGDAAELARLIVPIGVSTVAVHADAGAAEDDDGRAHAPGLQRLLGLFIFHQEAHAPHRFAQQEVLIQGGQTIGGRGHLGLIGELLLFGGHFDL